MKKKEMNGYVTLRNASIIASIAPEMILDMTRKGIVPSKKHQGKDYVKVEPLVKYIKQHKENTIMFGDRPYIDLDRLYNVFDGNAADGLPHATWFGKDRTFIDLHAAHDFLDKLVSDLKKHPKDTDKKS